MARNPLQNIFKYPPRSITYCLIGIGILEFSHLSCTVKESQQPKKITAIENMMQEYRTAWRKGDSTAILEKISADVILFQAGKKGKPIIGKSEVSRFWFPKSAISYPILQYDIEHEEIESDTHLAYYQGLSKLTWCTLEKGVYRDTIVSISEFTNILKKENGNWKLYRIMFNMKETDYTR